MVHGRKKSRSRLKMPRAKQLAGRRKRSQQPSCGCRKVRNDAFTRCLSSREGLGGCPPHLSELSLGSTMKTEFPDPDDILNFVLTIDPDEGMYRGGKFTFDFAINQNFPHEPPKVRCRETIYHPNIDLEGKVCLNILREDWKPVLNLNAVIVGLSSSSSQTPRTPSTRRPPKTCDITGRASSETCALP
ncbi:NEDD8-conjugating enzyme Ubc12 [Purpureocillium lilacinum]|uniref:NEDD8 carrier protein n=1 Tax=Purpureocillium lilacinum TaxID=33203 RepID=A0A179GA06_PURLI|nr:NEDD8-conjugating enzyme Ubc12 [Purpureocillium lilacinum]